MDYRPLISIVLPLPYQLRDKVRGNDYLCRWPLVDLLAYLRPDSARSVITRLAGLRVGIRDDYRFTGRQIDCCQATGRR